MNCRPDRQTDWLNCMKHSSPWETDSSLASQDIPHILWHLKAHYHILNSTPLIPVLSQINPIHSLLSRLFWVQFSQCPPTYALVLQQFSFSFPCQKPVCISLLPHTCHMHSPPLLPCLITLTILDKQYQSYSPSLCSFLQAPVTSSLLLPNITLSTWLSNTLRLCSSLKVRDQVSHPHKTAGKNYGSANFTLYVVLHDHSAVNT